MSARAGAQRPTRIAYDLDPIHRLCDAIIMVAASFISLGKNPLLMALAMIAALQLVPHLYHNRLSLSALDESPRLFIAGGIVSIVAVMLTDQGWTEVGMVEFWVLVSLTLVFGRVVTNALIRSVRRRKASVRRRTVILGGGPRGSDLADILREQPEFGLEPVAVAEAPGAEMGSRSSGLELREVCPGGLAALLRDMKACALIVADSRHSEMQTLEMLRECVRLDAEVFILPSLSEYISLEGTMERVRSYPLHRVRRAAYRSWTWKLKRPLGMLSSGLALIVLSPLLAVFALLIKLEDPDSPVLFRQVRVGVDEKPFELLKFRSMTPRNAEESDTTWNIAGDPRITRLGAFMRRYSIDELPQIYNVFRGDMAVVGPRPERPAFVEKFKEEHVGYHARHRVPVGLTGWAAANGLRGDTSIRERVQFDNFYIENWSLWLDVKIVILTVGAVLKGSGS